MKMKKIVGIIGFGLFGQFMAKHLEPYFVVKFYDPKDFETKAGYKRCGLHEVCQVDFLILAVPVQALEKVLIEIAPYLAEECLVMDVCSIKVYPTELMKKYIPTSISFMGTHPLFGPKSGADGIVGLNIVLCKGRINEVQMQKLKEFLTKDLKLNVIETTSNEHDQQMAYVQGLTHFIAKGFSNMKLPELFMSTASYEYFAKIKDMISLDSPELFEVIQKINPYTKKVRAEFLEELNKLDGW
jgi:prephenate dehydrogenase